MERRGRGLVTESNFDRLSAELARSEARFRDVIQRNADAIVVIDSKGEIAFANRAASLLFGKPADQLVGQQFGFPAVAGETTEIDLLSGGSARVVEMRVVDSEWEGSPACIATLRDATDRKRAEENARRLIREQAAHHAANVSARRFRFLADASASLAGILDYREMLETLPTLCIPELADWALTYRVENGVLHRVDGVPGDEIGAQALSELRDYPSESRSFEPVVDVVRSREPLIVREISEEWLDNYIRDPKQRELVANIGFASLIIVPLVARNNVLGAIAIARNDDAKLFDDQDLALAQDFAALAALALDNSRLYKEAREANQVKTDFLAVISHDLRTPLNAIIGYADLLALGIPDTLSDGSAESVTRIRKSASHLIYLIDELLAYARLESHRDEVRVVGTVISETLDDIRAVMQPLATSRGLDLVLHAPDRPITLHTDADKLRQILLNLVSNGVRYTTKGSVTLDVAETGGNVVFSVSDTGVGIAQENLQRIFEPFWQVNNTQRGPTTGTGLGLSVVQHLAQLLGGKITVQSTLGAGTTFTLTLPGTRPVARIGPDQS